MIKCINAGNKKHAHFRNALSLHVFQLAMAHQINFLKLSKILADHDWCIEWCKENNLLPSSLKCPRAGCHNALAVLDKLYCEMATSGDAPREVAE